MTLPAPKHYWSFNEGHGATASDSVGSAPLALTNPKWVPGKFGQAIRFNQTDGTLQGETNLLDDMQPPWTIAFWAMRDADSETGTATLFSSAHTAIRLEQFGTPRQVGITAFGKSDYSFDYTAPLHQRVHMTLVATETQVKLYVEGKLYSSVQIQAPIGLGLQWFGSSGFYEFASVDLDEVKVFDKALTDEQVKELTNEGGGTLTVRQGWGWGDNTYGQLMDGTTAQHNSPSEIPYLGKVALTAITSGCYHSLAMLEDGTVWGWGQNTYGQVGDGSTENRYAMSQVVQLRELGVKAIAAAPFHSLAVLKDGTAMAWGRNDWSQLGVGSNSPSSHPIPVQVVNLRNVKALAGGVWHSIALLEDGTLMAWGYNGYGQLGNGTNTNTSSPVAVWNLKGVKAIAGGNQHNLALLEDGTVQAWGYNNVGQLGDGTYTSRSVPVPVVGLKNVKAIAASLEGDGYNQSFSLALLEDGTVWAWGYNGYNELGDGTTTTRTTPEQVPNLTKVKAIAVGGWHALALKEDGTVWSWGYNAKGELGDGTTTQRSTPAMVANLSGIKVISAGMYSSLALR